MNKLGDEMAVLKRHRDGQSQGARVVGVGLSSKYGGSPVSSSRMVQPRDQMSEAVVKADLGQRTAL